VYRANLNEASTHQLTQIMEKYADHGWMIADTYNSLISAFGKRFDEFNFKELASFTKSLGDVGLRQGDIIGETINRIQQTAGRYEVIPEGGVADPKNKDLEGYTVSFGKVIIPIF